MLHATRRLARRLCRRRGVQCAPAPVRALRGRPMACNADGVAVRQLHVTAPARHDMAARAEHFARGKLRGEQPFEVAVKPLESFLGRSVRPEPLTDLTEDEIVALLRHTDRHVVHALYTLANTLTNRYFEKKVHFRGLLEFSNVCQKDCGYCGIRKHAKGVHRYTMTRTQIVETAMWAFENGYGSVMLQSGELVTDSRMAMVEAVIRDIRQSTIERDIANRVKLQRERSQRAQAAAATTTGASPTAAAPADLYIPPVPPKDFGATAKREQWLPYSNVGLGVALSLGELNYDLYQRMFDAGAHRYLLRIETSNPELYAALHPADHSHAYRIQCLKWLKQIGYQIGTGIMIGLPEQTDRHLAADLRFFRDIGADMIGMGPYICAPGTPTGQRWTELNNGVDLNAYNKQSFERATRMVALARVFLGNVTVAATTALQAINPAGREIALMRGANILMPLLTPGEFRADYQLYRNKPCIDEVASDCRGCLTARVKMADKEIAWGEWGDPHHFFFDISGNRLQPTPPLQAASQLPTANAAAAAGGQDVWADGAGATHRLPELPAEWHKRVQPVPAIVLENELKANAPASKAAAKVAPAATRVAAAPRPPPNAPAVSQTARANA